MLNLSCNLNEQYPLLHFQKASRNLLFQHKSCECYVKTSQEAFLFLMAAEYHIQSLVP